MSDKKNIVIFGGGMAGLSVGYFLSQHGGHHVTVLEKEDVLGGFCGSFEPFAVWIL